MNKAEEKRRMREWVECWKLAGPELERIRREEIRKTDTARAVAFLSGILESHVRRHPPGRTSGLVRQQAFFSRARA